MNVSHPSADFDSDVAAISGFIDLLQTGFENPENIKGTVLVIFPEYPDLSFIARYDHELIVERHDMGRHTNTQVTIPIFIIHRILSEFEYIDLYDPEFMKTISFTGNLAYADHLIKACIRPSNWTMARFRKAERIHAQKNYRNLTQLECLHRPSQRQILEAIEENRPVVITGLGPVFPCNNWTIDRLSEQYGDTAVQVCSAAHSQTMAEFVTVLKNLEGDGIVEGFIKPYAEGTNLPEGMWQDFGPLFFGTEDFIPPQLWLGAVPAHIPASNLHRDPLTNFSLQVIGRKQLALYSADQSDLLYPTKSYNNYQPCWFKPEAPDYGTYPRAQEAKCISLILNPGELLVLPVGWFHQAYALDSPNMSVSYFWRY